ncbi:acyl-CoA thioesterase II [Kineococcus glutinatus]|uniref:Acyl-CoA thioesterase II n=1 Tax=Kineococcus glutinatus TaxID=1070872 RepID=A0ABP9HRJ8_9ACTN
MAIPPDGPVDPRLPRLLAVLDVQPVPDRPDTFTAPSLPQPHGRVFGGQVVAQVALAAGRTVGPGRALHSMHGYFLRPGDVEQPLELAVERLRDGRSFSARRVQALQSGVPIFSMIASFQEPADGLEHAAVMPDVPGPQDLPSDADLLEGVDHPFVRAWRTGRPLEVRHVVPPPYFATAPTPTGQVRAVWMRVPGRLPDDDVLHRAVLGFASDYVLFEAVLGRHGLTWATPGMSVASLDHAVWWHRPVRVDEWLLYVVETPAATGARSLMTGRFFTADGTHVASVAQEGMIRVP